MDDRELAIRLAQHDDEALCLLVERHYAPIYRFLRRLGGSDEQARESTQETLLAIRRSAGSFKGRSAFTHGLIGSLIERMCVHASVATTSSSRSAFRYQTTKSRRWIGSSSSRQSPS